MEELGVIKYGELRFLFNISTKVADYFRENNVSLDFFFPKTQFFYQGVLMKLGITHTEKKDIEVSFNSLNLDNKKISESIDETYEKFEKFPIHIEKEIYYLDFGAKIK